MEPRGRGRGFGRARGQAGGQQQQRPGPQQQRPPRPQVADQQPPRGPPAAGAWVRPAQPAASAWPRPQMGAPQPQPPQPAAGRGGRELEGAVPRRVAGEGQGEGNEGTRGGANVRGRVHNQQLLFTRPKTVTDSKKGTSGTPITLMSNYFPLLHKGKWTLLQYRVDMNPDIDHTGKRRFLVREGVKDLIRGAYLFDGTVLLTPYQIPNDSAELFVKDGEENVKINIRLVGDLAWGDGNYIQAFNLMIRKCLRLMGLQLIGRNYFMPDSKITIEEHKIQLWPGYFTSIRQHESNILLNVDLQFKFMRTDNVYDLLMECMGSGGGRKEFQNRLIGCVVLTYYNNKTYRIDDIDFNGSPNNSFQKKDGSEITFANYFREKYGISIRQREQPLLVSRAKAREIKAGGSETVILIPELCQLTGLTDKQRENFSLMKTLANHTRIGVEGRVRKLMEFSDKIQSKPEVVAEIRRWDLGIADRLIQFQGRTLPMEMILGGGDSKYQAGPQADWTRELRTRPMLSAPKMERLAVVVPSRHKSACQDFIQILCKTASGMRWSLGTPKIFEIENDRASMYLENIEKIINLSQPTLILCILSNNSGDRYSAIKKKCYVDRGVPTQMFVARNLTSKGVMSIATKVVIQMNCKIGGAPWSVLVPLTNLMVVGYDVCRDTVNKKKSFSGMVASLDKQMTRYYSITTEHQMEEEISNNFATFMVMACNKFKKINGVFPDRIMIYRDGVGAGQLQYVYSHEVANIKRKLSEDIYKNGEQVKMAFVIVSKRINTRIFTPKDNPPPGTVVDDVITMPERYDYYIVSQCVRQGTVAPTNYNVIEDTIGLPPDRIQMLTYKLCHMYYNWSGTVRVPAPCQYAHKLAFLTSQSLHRPAHRDLENILYYL